MERGLTGRGGVGWPDGIADWLQAQCTGRSTAAPPHARFLCRRPALPLALGSRTWVRCAPGSACPWRRCVSPPCCLFSFSWPRGFSKKAWERPCFVSSPEEIGRQVVSRIPGWVVLRRSCTLAEEEGDTKRHLKVLNLGDCIRPCSIFIFNWEVHSVSALRCCSVLGRRRYQTNPLIWT